MNIFQTIISLFLLSLSLQNIKETFLNNQELLYQNIEKFNINDEVIHSNSENQNITYPSIYYNNFCFFFVIKFDLNDTKNNLSLESPKGLWLWLLQSPFNTTFTTSSNANNEVYEKYNGIGLKISQNMLIAILNNDSIIHHFLFNDIEDKTTSKYSYNLTQYKNSELYFQISLYNKHIYYEISNDNIIYKLWFVEELIVLRGNTIHFEFIANIKNGKMNYQSNHAYIAEFKGIKVNKTKKNNEKINILYRKFQQINQLIQHFGIYDLLNQQLNEYPLESIIEKNVLQLEAIDYINQIVNKSNSIISQEEQTFKLPLLFEKIRNVSQSNTIIDKKISLLKVSNSVNNSLRLQQLMNNSMYNMYGILAQSIEKISSKSTKMEKYKSFEKIFIIIILLSLFLLFIIYKTLSTTKLDCLSIKTTTKGIVQGEHKQIELV